MTVKAIILAAGKGTRMKSDVPKHLFDIAGRTMVEWVTLAANGIDERPVVVTNEDNDMMKSVLGEHVDYAIQHEQKGTGHAVMIAKEYFPKDGYIVVVLGDMALLRQESLTKLVSETIENKWSAALLTSIAPDPTGYGRIIRNENNNVIEIVEHKDATKEQLLIDEMNMGVACFEVNSLKDSLSLLSTDNAQGEYYLFDTVKILVEAGKTIGAVVCDFNESLGANDRAQLAEAGKIMRSRINSKIMKSGVTIIDPETTYISGKCKIGNGCTIYPNNILEGESVIGENSTLYPNNHIVNTRIGDTCEVRSSTLLDAAIGNDTTVGPNAYLRPKTVVGNNCRVGDFVEIKNSTIGNGTKISHLAYIGDADLGENINVSCGVVFVNYDGKSKFRSTVGDNAFIGCNANLVSPVIIGEGSYVAAGSTITDEVPKDALAIARQRQTNKENWAKKRRERGEL